MSFRIGAIHAFIAVDGDGDEGLVVIHGIPAIAADEKRLRELQPMVEGIAAASAIKVKLVRFDQRTDVETIDPGKERRQ